MQSQIAQALSIIAEHPDKAFMLTISGGSMHPTLVRGDRLELRKCARPINNGDIVLAREATGRYLIHRVVAVSPRVRTKGDALAEEDAEIEEVLALVVSIKKTWTSRARRLKLKLYGYLRALK